MDFFSRLSCREVFYVLRRRRVLAASVYLSKDFVNGALLWLVGLNPAVNVNTPLPCVFSHASRMVPGPCRAMLSVRLETPAKRTHTVLSLMNSG